MLWQTSHEPQRLTLCGFAGMPYAGRPIDVTASEKPSTGERRT